MKHIESFTEGALASALERGPSCPPIEKLVEAATRPMAAEAAESIRAHVAECPGCAAELELARAFQSPEASVEAEDLRWVVAQLEARVASTPAPARVLPMRHRSVVASWRLRAAAAALVAVALGLGWNMLEDRGAPGLPASGVEDVVRSGRVVLVAPLDAEVSRPIHFSWEAIPGAASYRVVLADVADEPIWEGESSGTRLDLPEAAGKRLESLVSYRWSVIARDRSGLRIAQSEIGEFRIATSPEN